MKLTILICARNAASTITRAVTSARGQDAQSIVVVDDWSDDDTGLLARQAGGSAVRVVRPTEHISLGFARQTAIEHVETPWLMWIDADDEALPGRAEALLAEAERSRADLVFDDAELFDGATGAKIKELPVPEFLRGDPTGSRQFERNFIPGSGWALMRTEFARRVGYDPEAHGVEDFDFCLRAIRANARFAFRRGVSYRQFAYPGSVSRDLYRRRSDLVRLYAKHAYEEVRRLVRAAGWPERVATWVLVSMAVFRQQHSEALRLVEALAHDAPVDNRVLEPTGPYPVPEGWRIAFQRGTLLALVGRHEEAALMLERARAWRPSAETLNNLGVVLHQLGRRDAALSLFEEALQQFPHLVDARRNRDSASPAWLTPLPLRPHLSRNQY